MHQEVDALQRIVVARRVRQKLFGSKAPVQLARYTPLEKIGAGGGGIVYRAYDQKLRREVAIKLIHGVPGQEIDVDPESVHAILSEARSIASLSHPNIVAVHDVGRVVGGELLSDVDHGEDEAIEAYFVVMEYVHGLDLGDWMREKKPEWAQILAVFEQAGQGLAAAHRAGLVHRDFKPANVVVGEDGRVRVIDFGLARPVAERGATGETRPGSPMGTPNKLWADLEVEPEKNPSKAPLSGDHLAGTPAYMSPETLAGERATPLSDQYSFCVTLYEAIFGLRPTALAPGESPSVLPETLHSLPAGTPDDLGPRLARGLLLDPGDRYSDLNELMRALKGGQRWSGFGLWVLGAAVLLLALGSWWQISPSSSCDNPAFVQSTRLFEERLAKLRTFPESPKNTSLRPLMRGTVQVLAERVRRWEEQSEADCRRHSTAKDDRSAAASEEELEVEHCLDQARLGVLALFDQSDNILAEGEESKVMALRVAADTLPDPDACASASWGEYGTEPLRPSLWHDYVRAMTRARLEHSLDDRARAYQNAQYAWTRARAGNADDERIDAGLVAGQAALALNHPEDAKRYFEQVYFFAVLHDRAVAQLVSAAFLVQVFELKIDEAGHLEKARWWWQQAQALAQRGVADFRALATLLWLQQRWQYHPTLFATHFHNMAQGGAENAAEDETQPKHRIPGSMDADLLPLTVPDLEQANADSYGWSYAVAWAASVWAQEQRKRWAGEPGLEKQSQERLQVILGRLLGEETKVSQALRRIYFARRVSTMKGKALQEELEQMHLESMVRQDAVAIEVENQLLLCFYYLKLGQRERAEGYLQQALKTTRHERQSGDVAIRALTLAAMNRLHTQLQLPGDVPWVCAASQNPEKGCDLDIQRAQWLSQKAAAIDADVPKADDKNGVGGASDVNDGVPGDLEGGLAELFYLRPFVTSRRPAESGSDSGAKAHVGAGTQRAKAEVASLDTPWPRPPSKAGGKMTAGIFDLCDWIVSESHHRLQRGWNTLSRLP